MDEKHRDGNFSLGPCHVEDCHNEGIIECPICLKFVCSSHTAAKVHVCEPSQLKVVKGNACAVDIFKALLFIKFLLQESKLLACQLQKVIASYFSPETLNKLSSNRKWYYYIASNKLWKQFCHFPELYWKNTSINNAALKKQQFSPFSSWKYNYDNECLLLQNWKSGTANLALGLEKRKGIRLISDFIDFYGKHWLFLTDNIMLYIWKIRNEPKFHCSLNIKFFKEIPRQKINITLSMEKLFIIWGNFVTAFSFKNPNYIPYHMYSFMCDQFCSFNQENFDFLSYSNIKNFCVYVLDTVIFGHAGYTDNRRNLDIHIWDPKSGNKIAVINLLLANDDDEISYTYVKSELCPLEHDVIFNVAVYLKNGKEMTFLVVMNIVEAIKHLAPCFSSSPFAFLSLSIEDCREPALGIYVEVLPKNIVFCKKVSKDVIITCRHCKNKLEFNIFKIEGGIRNDLYLLCEPLKNAVLPLKIHLFKQIGPMNGILCIAINNRQVETIDLKNLTERNPLPRRKKLCRVRNIRKIYFIDPKFLLVLFDKCDIVEIWDAEEGDIVTSVPVNECVIENVTWHKLVLVPPPKLIISTEEQVYILNFEQN